MKPIKPYNIGKPIIPNKLKPATVARLVPSKEIPVKESNIDWKMPKSARSIASTFARDQTPTLEILTCPVFVNFTPKILVLADVYKFLGER